jgi:phosphoenolpyruvate-protein kinase (PTS system EI component)
MHEQQPHQALNDDALVLLLDTLLSALKHSLMPYDAAGRLSGLTAIVAREYGIPAVVGVVGAIDRIRTGQLVTVDGITGIITLAHEQKTSESAETEMAQPQT